MRRLLMSRLIRIFTVCLFNLFFIPIIELWNKQGGCPNSAVCPNIPDFTLELAYPAGLEVLFLIWSLNLHPYYVCEQRRLCRVCTFEQTRSSLSCSTTRLVPNSLGGSFMNHLVRVIIILFVSRLLKIISGGRVRTRSAVKAISRMEVTDQTRLLFGKITSSIPTNSDSEIEFSTICSAEAGIQIDKIMRYWNLSNTWNMLNPLITGNP